jgi:hypothetical protein
MKKCFYCEIYDAKFDKKGNWLEERCKGGDCCYCKDRPEIHPFNCKVDCHALIHRDQIKGGVVES